MSDPGKNKHSIIASNRVVKQTQQQMNSDQHPGYQSQVSFERQLGLSGSTNITALSESAAGDRRSFPRVSSGSSSKNAFALETIRRELQRVQNGTRQLITSNTSNGSMQKENIKSSSFTDLRQGYAASSVDQQYLNVILSLPYGFDEGVVTETLRSYPNQTLEYVIEILKNNPNARKSIKPQNNGANRSAQSSRFGAMPLRGVNPASVGHSSLPRSSQHGNVGMQSQSVSSQTSSHGNGQPINKYPVNPMYKRPHETSYGGPSSHHNSQQLYDQSVPRQYSSNSERFPVSSSDQLAQYQHVPHYPEHRTHSNSMYPSSDLKGSEVSQPNSSAEIISWKPPRNMEQSANSGRASNMYDSANQKDSVTLRKKTVPDRKSSNMQNRWSAEVMVKTQYDYDKRNSMEVFPNRPPPPPYPGSNKTILHRISSQEGEFQTNKNTPITVIFDEKNNFVNVVEGIPEEFQNVPSSPSSEQSPPRSLQKEPPPYELAATSHQNPKIYNQQTSGSHNIGQLHHSHQQPSVPMHQQSAQDVMPPQSMQHQQQLSHQTQPQRPAPVQTSQPQQIYAPPHQLQQSQQSDSTFVPITETRASGNRGSPPPYPGATSSTSSLHKNSNRSSLNIDELEGTVSGSVSASSFGSSSYTYPPAYLMSESGASSKKTSTATEPGSFQSDSSASTSPTPDGVERSYSPLPLSSPCCDTMVIHSNNKKEGTQNHNADNEPFPTRLKNYTPQAYKFYMEQHVENLMKLQEQRKIRRQQLEAEMRRVGLASQAQEEMRKLLNQKESNYIRLRRAKMDKSMFTKIKVVGVGAFGEVSLVRKKETSAYYAMKTLRKSEVLRRNQVAHVKAERDILAEADNEWVVKLYYSFQDEQNLYFVMDYVPGGDLMALLIKFGIFEEDLARFYIVELVLAIESVHKLGFIHRDIKPDNILIDKNGHIKLTDFGLCTGFRWTHDSKYYQALPEGVGHTRQFSMEPEGGWESLLNDVNCNCKSQRLQFDLLKPLQRRKLRRHMRCQAHSLVGTPNYIAPEVLMRIPYSQQCDWWSVGVIMYEMLIGQPPFLAQSPAETQYKVINWRHLLRIPKHHNLPQESENLILRLCAAPEERIGKDGADEIKKHPYFNGVNFSSVHQEHAPYIPTIRNATDTSNFDPVPEGMCESDGEETDNATKKEGPEYAFYEFTFRHFFDDGGLVNPNSEFDVSEQEEPKQASKRPARDETNYSNPVPPNKVPAQSNSTSDEKTPIYV